MARHALKWMYDQLMVPVMWFWGLDFYDWKLPIVVLVVLVIFYRALSVSWIKAVITIEDTVADVRFNREWGAIARMNDRDFEQFSAALQERADEKEQQAEGYENRALENRFRYLPGSRRNLLLSADRCRDQRERIMAQIAQHQKLRAEVVKRREEHEQQSGMQQVIDILNRLNSSNSREALDALQALNSMRNVDWSAVVATHLPPQARSVVIKCLRLMTSTTNLHEARNAYVSVSEILRRHGMNWEDIAA